MLSRLIAHQLGKPSPITGWLTGWVWNWRNAELNNTALGVLDLHPGDRVLDIGFGGGYLLRRMAAQIGSGFLAGVDVSPAIVEAAEKRNAKLIAAGKLELRCAPAEQLPFPAEYFTHVCSINSIFYWSDPGQGVAEMRRVLQTGGIAVLCFTCKESLERKSFAQNIHLFEPQEVGNMLVDQGFVEVQSFIRRDRYREYAVVTARKTEA